MSDDYDEYGLADLANIDWQQVDRIAATHMAANPARGSSALPGHTNDSRTGNSVASGSRAIPLPIRVPSQDEGFSAQAGPNRPRLDAATLLASLKRFEQSRAGRKPQTHNVSNSKFLPAAGTASLKGQKRPHPPNEESSAPSSPVNKRFKINSNHAKLDKEEVREVLKGFEEDLTCPICFDFIVGCHSANPCGHAACGPCSAKWMIGKAKATCFACRATISACNPLIPTLIVDGMVEKHLLALAKNGDKEWDIGGSKRKEWEERKGAWAAEQARLKAKAEEDEARRIARLNNLRRSRYYLEEEDSEDEEYMGPGEGSEDEEDSSEEDDEEEDWADQIDEIEVAHAAGPIAPPPPYWVYPEYALLPAPMHGPVAYADHVAIQAVANPHHRAGQAHPQQAPQAHHAPRAEIPLRRRQTARRGGGPPAGNPHPPPAADPAHRPRTPQMARRGRAAASAPRNAQPAPRNNENVARTGQAARGNPAGAIVRRARN